MFAVVGDNYKVKLSIKGVEHTTKGSTQIHDIRSPQEIHHSITGTKNAIQPEKQDKHIKLYHVRLDKEGRH